MKLHVGIINILMGFKHLYDVKIINMILIYNMRQISTFDGRNVYSGAPNTVHLILNWKKNLKKIINSWIERYAKRFNIAELF